MPASCLCRNRSVVQLLPITSSFTRTGRTTLRLLQHAASRRASSGVAAIARGASPDARASQCMVASAASRSSKRGQPAVAELPTERQKTLNKYLGLPLEQIQTRVDSLFRKQSTTVSAGVASSTSTVRAIGESSARATAAIMKIDATSSDVEEVQVPSTANNKKRRVVASSEDESGNANVDGAGPSKKAPTAASSNGKTTGGANGRAKSRSKSPGTADRTNGDAHTDKKAKTEGTANGKPAPKVASIFSQPKRAMTTSATSSAPTKKDASSSSAKSTAKGKGKAKAKSSTAGADAGGVKGKEASASGDEAVNQSETEEQGRAEAEEEESEMESEEEQEQAVKLAEIFTKKVAGSSKGKYGKGIEWKAGEPVPYAAIAEVFQRIDSTTKRLEIAEYLTNFLMSVIERTPRDLIKVVYLCINRLSPDYEGLELGIGEGMLKKAIAQATGVNVAHINTEYKKAGDLGLVAMNSRATQSTLFKPKPLTVAHVFNKLREIAKTTGASSQNKKVGAINGLLAACQGEEAKFIIRSCEGKLRIGLAEQTVLGSLAAAIVSVRQIKEGKKLSSEKIARDLEEGSRLVKTVFSECPNYDIVIPPLLEGGPENLREKIRITPGVPLKPMLAKPTKAISEVLDRFEGKKFTCEYKYDGERAQVHYAKGKLSVFSRNSEDMSVKYPDLLEHMQRCIKPNTDSFVLDAEAVAWDKEEGKILPFQELSKRKRKDVKAEDIKVKVHIFAFDLLYLNGESLLKKDLESRRALLREHFIPVEGQFAFAKTEDIYAVEEIQAFLDQSIKESCEGLMVKMMQGEDATYEPSRRSMNWLKLKKDYLAGVGDSFDLVVIGGYYGRGKRTSVYGAFLLACYDPESETYQAITKIGTGFSEEMLDSHYKFLNPLETQVKKAYYDVGDAKPDCYFEPKMLWEVLAADLSLSPVYTAAKGMIDARGISLRFPRFIRIRDDKDPEDASNAEFVAEAYQRQTVASGAGGKRKKGDAGDPGDGFW